MENSLFYSYAKEFITETSQLNSWINYLSEIKSQANILRECTESETKIYEAFGKNIIMIINNYYNDSAIYSDEPSKLYEITKNFSNIFENGGKLLTQDLLMLNVHVGKYLANMTQEVDKLSKNIIQSSLLSMEELSNVKKAYNSVQVKYVKLKADIEEAHLAKKKIEVDPKLIYNISLKNKAEQKILGLLKDMQMILPDFELRSKELENKKTAFNKLMKESFELVVGFVFKNHVKIRETFFLLSKEKEDLYNRLNQVTEEKLSLIKETNFQLNDFVERKYAELKNIYFDSLDTIILNDDDFLANSLLKVTNMLVNYAENFYNLTKKRKRILKEFHKFLAVFSKTLESFSASCNKIVDQIHSQAGILKDVGKTTKKAWNIFQLRHSYNHSAYTSMSKYLTNSANVFILKTAKEIKAEYVKFLEKWTKLVKQINNYTPQLHKAQQKRSKISTQIEDLRKALAEQAGQNTQKIENKIKQLKEEDSVIRDQANVICKKLKEITIMSIEFLKLTIKNIREEELKKLEGIVDILISLSSSLKNINEQNLTYIGEETDTCVTTDIYEEVKEIFSSYLDKYNITEKFLEIIIKKIIKNSNFSTNTYAKDKLNAYLIQRERGSSYFFTQSNVNNNFSSNNLTGNFGNRKDFAIYNSNSSNNFAFDGKHVSDQNQNYLNNNNLNNSLNCSQIEQNFNPKSNEYFLISSPDNRKRLNNLKTSNIDFDDVKINLNECLQETNNNNINDNSFLENNFRLDDNYNDQNSNMKDNFQFNYGDINGALDENIINTNNFINKKIENNRRRKTATFMEENFTRNLKNANEEGNAAMYNYSPNDNAAYSPNVFHFSSSDSVSVQPNYAFSSNLQKPEKSDNIINKSIIYEMDQEDLSISKKSIYATLYKKNQQNLNLNELSPRKSTPFTHQNVMNSNINNINNNLDSEINNTNYNQNYITLNNINGDDEENVDTSSIMDDTLESFEEDKMNFINLENFKTIENNGYENIKENEIKEYLDKLNAIKGQDKDGKNLGKDPKAGNFRLEADEKLIDKFSCAFADKILLQGKLYITSKKLAFRSMFNNKTLFGTTKLVIPLHDIERIDKKYNLFFDNSLEIITKKTKLFFTSFVSRDICYKILSDLVSEIKKSSNNNNEDNEDKENENNNCNGDEYSHTKGGLSRKMNFNIANKTLKKIDFIKRLDSIHKENLEKYEKENAFKPLDFYKNLYFKDEPMGNVALPVIYNYIFNPDVICEELKCNKTFWESLFILRKDYDMTFENNKKVTIPTFFADLDYTLCKLSCFSEENLNEFLEESKTWSTEPMTYTYKLTHPIKKKMFGPERVNLTDNYNIFFISPKMFVVEEHSNSAGFTYCDYFVSMTQYRFYCDYKYDIKENSFKFNTKMSIGFQIHFLKSCMFKGMIETEGAKESEESIRFNIFEKINLVVEGQNPIFNEYFKKMTEENLQILALNTVVENENEANENGNNDNDDENDNTNNIAIQGNLAFIDNQAGDISGCHNKQKGQSSSIKTENNQQNNDEFVQILNFQIDKKTLISIFVYTFLSLYVFSILKSMLFDFNFSMDKFLNTVLVLGLFFIYLKTYK